MARMASTGEVAGTYGRAIGPEDIPEEAYDDYQLALIPERPKSDEEFAVAHGHGGVCLRTGVCECNPYSTTGRDLQQVERRAWPYWRATLARRRAVEAFEAWAEEHDLLDDRGRAPAEFIAARGAA